MCEEGTVTDWTCQMGFTKFPAQDFSWNLDDAPQVDRTVEVDSN